MSVPAVQRIIVGVDGSAESVVALRWACREASLRGAEVHAVHVREAPCHSKPSYAARSGPCLDDVDVDAMWRSALPGLEPAVRIRTEVAEGLAARVLLDRCAGADMLVLGTAGGEPGAARSAGPVIRACLRRASCPVVVIGAAQQPLASQEEAAGDGEVRMPMPVAAIAPQVAPVPAGARG